MDYIEHLKLLPDFDINSLTMLPLSDIELNDGQLVGLPKNPRSIKKAKFEKLKKNIETYPEMLAWRSLLVYPLDNGKYIIIGGNMRYRAMLELDYKDAPCVIIPKETSIEKLKAYTILDNSGFGRWEWSMLANEWDADALAAWGLDLPMNESEIDVDSFFDKLDKEAEKDKGEKITVSIPDKYADQKEEIKSRIEATLMGEFEGIKIK